MEGGCILFVRRLECGRGDDNSPLVWGVIVDDVNGMELLSSESGVQNHPVIKHVGISKQNISKSAKWI